MSRVFVCVYVHVWNFIIDPVRRARRCPDERREEMIKAKDVYGQALAHLCVTVRQALRIAVAFLQLQACADAQLTHARVPVMRLRARLRSNGEECRLPRLLAFAPWQHSGPVSCRTTLSPYLSASKSARLALCSHDIAYP